MAKLCLDCNAECIGDIDDLSGVGDVLFDRKHGSVIHDAGETCADCADDVIEVIAVIQVHCDRSLNGSCDILDCSCESFRIDPSVQGVMFRIQHNQNRLVYILCCVAYGVDRIVVDAVKCDNGSVFV